METPPHDFDPQARFIARDGQSYENFKRYLQGRAEEDPVNYEIRSLRQEGRSEAFCRTFRQGWEGDHTSPSPTIRKIEAFAHAVQAQFVPKPLGPGRP